VAARVVGYGLKSARDEGLDQDAEQVREVFRIAVRRLDDYTSSSLHATILGRFRACLLGFVLGDAIAVAKEGRDIKDLKSLEGSLGMGGDTSHKVVASKAAVVSGMFELPLGSWSERTATMLCVAESICHLKTHDSNDIMMRLLRLYRVGVGSCQPGRCMQFDKFMVNSLESFERQQGQKQARMNAANNSSAALSRVLPIAMFLYSHPAVAIQTASVDTSSTHESLSCRDASRYLAALLVGIFSFPLDYKLEEIKETVFSKRFCPAGHSWSSKPLSSEVRDLADGRFDVEKCPANLKDAAPDVLCQAMWALKHSQDFVSGIDLLLKEKADRAVLSTYGCLAGSLYGEGQLPETWISLLHKGESIGSLAEKIHEIAENVQVEVQGRTAGSNE